MMDSEKLYLSKAALRRELNICQARYEQWVAAGIIPPPVTLTPHSRAFHKRQDVETARRRFNNKTAAAQEKAIESCSKTGGKRIKPISEKHLAQLRATRVL